MWRVIKRALFIGFVVLTLPIVFVVYGCIGVYHALGALKWKTN